MVSTSSLSESFISYRFSFRIIKCCLHNNGCNKMKFQFSESKACISNRRRIENYIKEEIHRNRKEKTRGRGKVETLFYQMKLTQAIEY